MAAGGRLSQCRTPWAAAIAHFFRYEARMKLHVVASSILLLSSVTLSWGFEPDYDKHIGLSPTNVEAYGISFHFSTNVSAVEIVLPRKFEGVPFKAAMLHFEASGQYLQIPIQPLQEESRVVISFWMDPKSLCRAGLRITFKKPGSLAGVQFHLDFDRFIDETGKPHNHALHRTAAPRFSFDAPGFPDTGFAASARFRRRSVS
jgi:hypothetical protein